MQGNVDDDVFDAAQQEVYELMRLDLFPRFCEQLNSLSMQDETSEAQAASVSEVTSGTNPAATRSFMRFAREQQCEETLLFWLEANDYALLFQPSDQQTRGQAIFDSYLGPTAKTKTVSNATQVTPRQALKVVSETAGSAHARTSVSLRVIDGTPLLRVFEAGRLDTLSGGNPRSVGTYSVARRRQANRSRTTSSSV